MKTLLLISLGILIYLLGFFYVMTSLDYKVYGDIPVQKKINDLEFRIQELEDSAFYDYKDN